MDEAQEHDFAGFVEFCVGDLEPNSEEEVSGWFELRLPLRLLGTGRARFRAHSRRRDEDCDTGDIDGLAVSSTAPPAFLGGQRRNAGELHVSLHLRATVDPYDEWYAFCFPRPTFTVFHRFVGEADDKISPLDVMYLWRDIAAIKGLIWEQGLRQVVSISTYLTSWQFPPLSLAFLAWWLCMCWVPRWLIPTLLLWAIVWLALLRLPNWRKRILAHQATASLDQEGYELVSTLGDSKRVAFWVERVVRDLGGQVLSLKALDKFASLIYRNRKPLLTFPALIEALRKEGCIKWPALWAPLNDAGLRKVVESRDSHWAQNWLRRLIESRDGVVQDQHKLQRFAIERLCGDPSPSRFEDVLRALRKQPWIVWRDFGLGEDTGGMNDAGWWARIPAWVIPRPVERLAFRLANPIEDYRKSLAKFFRWSAVAFDQSEKRLARRIYLRCFLLSAVLSLVTLHINLNKVLFTMLALASFSHRFPGVRQILTARRASADLMECQARRETGVITLWAFFMPGRPMSQTM